MNDKVLKLSRHFTIGALYRLFIPDVLHAIDKVIYLDCDIMVNMGINELWGIDLENKSIAGVQGYLMYRKTSWFNLTGTACRLEGLNPKKYINSGVIVMDLRKIRNHVHLADFASSWLLKNAHIVLFADQDALNAIFMNDIKFIDERFNDSNCQRISGYNISNAVIHAKPWKELLNEPYVLLYWDMYLRSAWGENITPHELIEKLSIISGNMKKNLHHSFKQCLFRVAGALWKRISFRKQRRIIKLILSDIIYRLRYKFSH